MALPRWPSHFIILCLISFVQAYTIFETNCSTPVTLSNYVSSPNTRGTLDILWSSLFTIFACTWSVQHPNLPEQQEAGDQKSKPRGLREWIYAQWKKAKWGLKGFYRSTLRMLATVIAPELILMAACQELVAARMICKSMRELDLGQETWSLTHSYYANMGGFVVQNPSADKTIYHDPYHLHGNELLELRKKEHIAKLPDISEAEIKDKSKGDVFGKLIATGQITWSTVQIIARLVRKLPVSPLEVAVVAFATCAALIYGLYWEKPQRVGVTQTIQLNANSQLYNQARLNETESPRVFKDFSYAIFGEFLTSSRKDLLRGAPISLDSALRREVDTNMQGFFLAAVVPVSAALFGGIHAIAWNFPFPSTIELIFWRCATIYTAASPVCAMLLMFLAFWIEDSGRGLTRFLYYPFGILGLISGALYPIARLFILVEMFRTLYFLPPGSFISTWATSFPHVT